MLDTSRQKKEEFGLNSLQAKNVVEILVFKADGKIMFPAGHFALLPIKPPAHQYILTVMLYLCALKDMVTSHVGSFCVCPV